MCLALPMRVIEFLPGEMAVAERDGIRKEISVTLVPEVAIGDYVIVHVGFALAKLDPAEARRTLALIAEMAAPGPR